MFYSLPVPAFPYLYSHLSKSGCIHVAKSSSLGPELITSFIYMFVSLKSLIIFTSRLEVFALHFPSSGADLPFNVFCVFVLQFASLHIGGTDNSGSYLFCFLRQ